MNAENIERCWNCPYDMCRFGSVGACKRYHAMSEEEHLRRREKERERQRQWYRNHAEERKAHTRAYVIAHKDEINAKRVEQYHTDAEYRAYRIEKSKMYAQSVKDDPEKLKHIREYRKAYYEANKEKILAYNKARYEADKAEIIESRKAYYQANKEKISEYYKANREKKNAAARKRYAENKAKIV